MVELPAAGGREEHSYTSQGARVFACVFSLAKHDLCLRTELLVAGTIVS